MHRIIKAIKQEARKEAQYETKVMCVIYKLYCSHYTHNNMSNVFALEIFHVSSFAPTPHFHPRKKSTDEDKESKIFLVIFKCAPYS